MTMFITGGTSSIGRVLIKEFSRQGIAMRVLARKNSNRAGLELAGVDFIEGDVTDPETVKKGMAGCSRVTHMAAVVGSDVPESEWWRVNRDGTCNVLQAAFDQGIESMVQVSSLSVLGSTVPGETADESRPINTSQYVNLYQKTKHAADEIARDFAAKGLPVKIVYPGFGFGCSQASSHPSLQDQTLLRMAAGKPVVVMGSGKNKLCVAYYDDTVAGIALAHQRGAAGDDYILGNDNVTFVELWGVIARVLGKEPPRARLPIPLLKTISRLTKALTGKPVLPAQFFEMIDFEWCFSNTKARQALGWQPRSVIDAMMQTWKDYTAQGWTAK